MRTPRVNERVLDRPAGGGVGRITDVLSDLGNGQWLVELDNTDDYEIYDDGFCWVEGIGRKPIADQEGETND